MLRVHGGGWLRSIEIAMPQQEKYIQDTILYETSKLLFPLGDMVKGIFITSLCKS